MVVVLWFPTQTHHKKACACTLMYTYAHIHTHTVPKHAVHTCMHTQAHASTHTCTHTCLVNALIKGLCSPSSGPSLSLVSWALLLPSSAVAGAGNPPALSASSPSIHPSGPCKAKSLLSWSGVLPLGLVHTECRSRVDPRVERPGASVCDERDSQRVVGLGKPVSSHRPGQHSSTLEGAERDSPEHFQSVVCINQGASCIRFMRMNLTPEQRRLFYYYCLHLH